MADDKVLTEQEQAEALQSLPGWEIRDGMLRKTYHTPGWSHTLMLVNTIGYLSEAAWHHPDLAVSYAQVTVKLITHRVKAISDSDVALARKIEESVLWLPEPGSPLQGYHKREKKWVH